MDEEKSDYKGGSSNVNHEAQKGQHLQIIDDSIQAVITQMEQQLQRIDDSIQAVITQMEQQLQ